MAVLEKVFVLGEKTPGKFAAAARVEHLRNRRAIRAAVRAVVAPAALAWVAADQDAAEELVEEALERRSLERGKKPQRFGKLVLLAPPRLDTLGPAQDLFSKIAWTADGPKHWLPTREVVEILSDAEPRNYIIGGTVHLPSRTLRVYRGDLSRVMVPLAVFKPTGEGVMPDPTDFEVIDSGQAIRLGSYEAVADAVFYEADPAFRRRLRERLRAEERTFGASLRRLRLQRNLRQSDFVPLPARTVLRIENGEVGKPHGKTLDILAKRLEVTPDAIETY